MRIAYVAFLPTGSIGVERHIVSRAKAAHALGLKDFDFVVIGGSPAPQSYDFSNLKYLSYPVPRYSARYFRNIFRRFNVIEAFLHNSCYERIILRYPGADHSAEGFFSRFSTITEHHTDELSEMQSRIHSGLPFAETQMKKIRFLLERQNGGISLRKCDGLIGVTDEIRRIELARASTFLKSAVIANGIDVESVSHTGFMPFNGNSLDIAFVASRISICRSPWYGLDRILSGLNDYAGSVKINLHLIGQIESPGIARDNTPNKFVTLHGEKKGSELDALLGSMNLAISSLALHRLQMSQACTLKTREYVARGLPFVLAYDDPDLVDTDPNNRFFLRLPASDDNVSFEEIVDFARETSKLDSIMISESMRTFAFQKLDWKRKVAELWDFASTL